MKSYYLLLVKGQGEASEVLDASVKTVMETAFLSLHVRPSLSNSAVLGPGSLTGSLPPLDLGCACTFSSLKAQEKSQGWPRLTPPGPCVNP